MIVYKFSGHTTKLWTAYTKDKDGSNLPNIINDKEIKWEFINEVEYTDGECLREINNNGYCIVPKLTLELGKEQIFKIEKSPKTLRYINKKSKPK